MCILCTQNHGFLPFSATLSLRQIGFVYFVYGGNIHFILLYNFFFRQLEIKENVQPTNWFLSYSNQYEWKISKSKFNRWNVTDTLSLKRCWSSSDFRPQSDLIFDRTLWTVLLALRCSHSNTLTHTYIIHVLAKKKCQHVRKAANWRYVVMRVSFDFNSFHLTLLYIKYTFVTLHHAYITWVMSVCVRAFVQVSPMRYSVVPYMACISVSVIDMNEKR